MSQGNVCRRHTDQILPIKLNRFSSAGTVNLESEPDVNQGTDSPIYGSDYEDANENEPDKSVGCAASPAQASSSDDSSPNTPAQQVVPPTADPVQATPVNLSERALRAFRRKQRMELGIQKEL
ncbi:hypothetical protein O0L34_g9342 [Tuta absoluta]|nr:hypothetical protein O0L34_g9342 [Tuta absoluta]